MRLRCYEVGQYNYGDVRGMTNGLLMTAIIKCLKDGIEVASVGKSQF